MAEYCVAAKEMTGLDSVPLINPASEVEGLDVIRPVKTDDVENGNMFSNCDGSLQPQTENASSLKVDQLNEERAESSSSVPGPFFYLF